MRRQLKRIGIDVAGYGLILLGIALGWLPGPGGIPLVLAGLGLLSIHNAWARRVRDYLLTHGGRAVQLLFPPTPWAEALYDLLAVLLLALVAVLAWQHAGSWQIGLAGFLFFLALFVAFMNRGRLERLKRRR